MIGSLITAGTTLLGGLFGSKKKTTSSVDYVKMAANATKAGFNPLTAIRNGGSAGFTTTTSSDMSSLGGALQSLGGPLGEAMSKKFDPLEQKKRQLDTALVDYQLRQLQQGPKAMPGQLYPGGQSSGVKVSTHVASTTKGGFIGPPMPEHIKLDKPLALYVTGIDDNGKRHRLPNPDLPDLDQMLVPSSAVVGSEAADGVRKAPSWWDSWTYHQPTLKPFGPHNVPRYRPPMRAGGW